MCDETTTWRTSRTVAAAAGQTFIGVGGRSRQAEAAGVDESLIASWWCAVDFFAHVAGFFTGDAVECQKTHTLFSLLSRRRRRERLPSAQWSHWCSWHHIAVVIASGRRNGCPGNDAYATLGQPRLAIGQPCGSSRCSYASYAPRRRLFR